MAGWRPKPAQVFKGHIEVQTWRTILELYCIDKRLRGLTILAQERGISWRVVRQAYNFGWPELRMPPLVDIEVKQEEIDRILGEVESRAQEEIDLRGQARAEAIEVGHQVAIEAQLRERNAALHRQGKDPRIEEARRKAQEIKATKGALEAAMQAVLAAKLYGREILKLVEGGQMDLPAKVDARAITSLARAVNVSTGALERAVRVERLRSGRPAEVVGVQIGLLLETATDDELGEIQRTGRIPPRILGLSRAVEPIDRDAIDVEIEEDDAAGAPSAGGEALAAAAAEVADADGASASGP